ncbi:MAG: glycosyltransferase family 4 protein [Fibrobacterales bacterium]
MIYIYQPCLPRYRIPFFTVLAERIPLTLIVGATDEAGLASVSAPDLNVITVPSPKLYFNRVSWYRTSSVVSYKKGDVVVINGNPRILSNIPLVIKARIAGASIVWYGQGWSSGTSSFTYLVRKIAMRLVADAIVLYTDAEVEDLVKSMLLRSREDQIFATNNGLDLTPIEEAKRTMNRTQESTMILYCGRLTQKSNIMEGLDACALLHKRGISFHFTIVGDGPLKSLGEERARVLGIDEFCSWEGAVYDESLLARYYMDAQIFFYPGAVGLSLMHAMAYGVPAVVHNIRKKHMPEIAAFTHEQTGLAYTYGDAESAANALEHLLLNSEQCRTMGDTATEVITKGYTTDTMAERFHSAITYCLIQNPPARKGRCSQTGEGLFAIGPSHQSITGQSIAFQMVVDAFPKATFRYSNVFRSNHSIVCNLLATLWYCSSVVAHLLIKRPNVLYISTARTRYGLIKDLFPLMTARFLKTRVVNHLHGADFVSFYESLFKVERVLLHKAYNAIDTSIVLFDGLKAQYSPFPHMNCVVIPNAVPDSIFYEEGSSDQGESFNFLYLSSIMRDKGIFILLGAIASLKAEGVTGFTVTIAGGFENDAVEKEFFDKIGGLSEVTYLGSVSGRKKRNALNGADVFVLPTYYPTEAQPISIIEAMACGTAILTTRHNYLPEMVDAKRGVVVQPGSVSELAKAMGYLMSHRDYCEELKVYNRTIASNDYKGAAHIAALKKELAE